MQSKTSFFNMAMFKKNLSRTWIVGLLYFIALLLMLPISFVLQVSDFENSWYFESGYTREIMLYQHMQNAPRSGLALIVAIVVTGITFWFLFNKRDNYMMHAFPVNRKSLFCTGFISASIVSLVPLVVNSIIMTIVAFVEKAPAIDAIWYWTLIVAVATELFISIAVFSMMTSGQIITSVVFYFIFCYLYTLMEIAFRIAASFLMFGMSSSLSDLNTTMLTPSFFISANCGINAVVDTDDYGNLTGFSYNMTGGHYLAIYAVVAVVITFIAYMLYKYKKLETVHDFIAVPFLKPVFSVGMSFFISMVAGGFVAEMINAAKTLRYSTKFAIAIVSAIIIGCIIFYATQMMIEKTVRVFSSKKFLYCAGYTAAALVVLLCLRFDVFKIENKVPNANDIEWIGFSCDYTMVFTDEDEINTMRELHQNFLEDKKELRDVNVTYKDVPGNSFTIKYKLKNGKTIIRDYSVVDTESEEVSAQYVAATEPILDFVNAPSRIKQHVIGNIWDDCTITEMSFSGYIYDEGLDDYTSTYVDFDYLTDREKHEKFSRVYEALLKDVDEGKVFTTSFGTDYYNDTDKLYNDFNFTLQNKKIPYFSDMDFYWGNGVSSSYYTRYEQNIYVALTEDCTNTLQALKEEGFYTDDEEILTYGEYNERMGYLY